MRSKKLLSVILTICAVTLSFFLTPSISAQNNEDAFNQVSQVFAELDNTMQKEFIINNKYDFTKFITTPEYWESNYKIKLTHDINTKKYLKFFNSIKTFRGQFDGGGHTIKNTSFKYFVENNCGTILNVNFENCKLSKDSECGFVLNNEENGLIDNCSIKNMNSKSSNIKAGFVCTNIGKITNSKTDISIKNGKFLGGFVSINLGTIEACTTTGKVTGSEYVGGFVAINKGTITECNVKGNVNGNYYCVGGFVGENYGIIKDCTFDGKVDGKKIGWERFAGYLHPEGKIINCKIVSRNL